MATGLHRDLPDSELHEVKGAASATTGHVLTADGLGAATFQPASGGGAIFGSEFNLSESLGFSTTTSTNFQTKVTLPITVPAGTYIVDAYYQWNHDNVGNDFEARLRQDAVDLALHKQEPKDAAGTLGATGTSQRYSTLLRRVLVLTAGSYTFDLQYRTDSAGDESSIWNANIVIYRAL